LFYGDGKRTIKRTIKCPSFVKINDNVPEYALKKLLLLYTINNAVMLHIA